MNTKAGWGRTVKAAFPYTVPVMTGYLVLSAAYGVLMQSKGYGPLWSTLTSALAFSGSMQYAAVILFAGTFDPLAALIFSITINARYIFCSIGVLNRFAAAGPFRPFLYFALSDESFALASPLLFRKGHPKLIDELTPLIPPAVIGLLVVYSLKDVNLASGAHGLPELIAIAVTAGVHLWRKNMILTIILGTAVYMLLTQLVFA